MTVAQARIAAIKELGAMHGGEDPAPAPELVNAGPTFGEALALHIDRLRRKGGRPRSISSIESEAKRHLDDWSARRLADITRTECRALHERLTDTSGPYLANRLMRYVRAVYNTALKEHDLPVNPTVAVHWNKEERRQEPIPWVNLPVWRSAIDELSPVRRDYQFVVLLTGLRRMDAATIRREHVDFEARTLHRANPKGGADRAFTIPLSRACLEILARRRADNRDDAGWAFPTDALKGRPCDLCAELGLPRHRVGARIHLVEAKEAADEIVSPHRLRDTYTSALAEVGGISGYAIDVLTNHRPPRGSVTPAGMSLRSWQRAQSAASRVGWDDASRALLREAVTRGRLSAGALERLAAAPHWIVRALVLVLKLEDPGVMAPVPRGHVAARIAATVRAFEAGNPLLRQLADAPCPCGGPGCGRGLAAGDGGKR
jgi:integrase